jgi:hypothetical protein
MHHGFSHRPACVQVVTRRTASDLAASTPSPAEIRAGLSLPLDEQAFLNCQQLPFELLRMTAVFLSECERTVLLLSPMEGRGGVSHEVVMNLPCSPDGPLDPPIPWRIFISRRMRRSSFDLNRAI